MQTSRTVLNIFSMSGFSHASYNSSFPIPYSNFLELNSASLDYMYVPYSSCDDLSICVQKGFIIDTEIDNPHYFGETNFISFENHAHLPMRSCALRQNTKRHPSKEERSTYCKETLERAEEVVVQTA